MSVKTYFQQDCPRCRKAMRIDIELLGRVMKCEGCGADMVARQSEPSAPPRECEIPEMPLLIVDCQRERLGHLAYQFAKNGYCVIPVHHPRMALEAATSRAFHVAIVDYALPEIDGLELTQKLMRRVEDLRVIVLLDADYGVPAEAAYAAGAWHCLDRSDIATQLDALVEEAHYSSHPSLEDVSNSMLRQLVAKPEALTP